MKLQRSLSLALVLLLAAAGVAQGEKMGMALFAPAKQLRAPSPPPLKLAERAGVLPLALLEPAVTAAQSELDLMIMYNRLGRLPVQNGFARPLPVPQRVRFAADLLAGGGFVGEHAGGVAERLAGGDLVWGAEVRVAGAHRLRLHLAEVALPAGTEMWVYGEGGETVGPFGLELAGPGRDLWTPSVGGEALRLELRIPAGAASQLSSGAVSAPTPAAWGFRLDRVMEIFDGSSGALGGLTIEPRAGECLLDAQCVTPATFDVIEFVQQGVAAIEFVDGGSFVCSGGLLNSLSGDAFFLTANHCFDNQPAASSLEAFWDFYSNSCNGSSPPVGGLPRSNGATLLSTGTDSDHTLLLLNNLPANRTLLGWDPNPVANGTRLHRVSNPVHPETFFWLSQQYSTNRVDTSAEICGRGPGNPPADRPEFIYEAFDAGEGDLGGTFGGSSGAPAIRRGAGSLDVFVVGQLTGGCPQVEGADGLDGCDYTNAEVDGAFSTTFDAVGGFLLGDEGCVPGPTTLCLRNNRFKVEIEWENQQGVVADANVVPGVQSSDSGLFYFNNPNNWEFLIKVLNGCGLTNHYWVFFAATTDVAFEVTVTDTQGPEEAKYVNTAGNPADAITDTRAFATCP